MNNELNLELVPSNACDYEDYYAIRCGEADIYWMGYTSGPDKEFMRSLFLERLGVVDLTQPEAKRIYMLRVDGASVGYLMLSNMDDGIEIGISIVAEYCGCGLGSKTIELAKLIVADLGRPAYAQIRDDNIASQKTFIKNGFRRTEQYVLREYPGAGKVKFRRYVLEGDIR